MAKEQGSAFKILGKYDNASLDFYDDALDYRILSKINPDMSKLCHALEIDAVLNVNHFVQCEGRHPSIGSIFMYGSGGSYDFDFHDLRINIYNGTLSNVSSATGEYCPHFDLWTISECYYQQKYGATLINFVTFEKDKILYKNTCQKCQKVESSSKDIVKILIVKEQRVLRVCGQCVPKYMG